MNEPDRFEVGLEESVDGLEWGTMGFGTVGVPQTCLALRVEVTWGIQA